MLLNLALYGEGTTTKTKMAVGIMLVGVTLATVTDVDVGMTGFLVGMLAVIGAAQQQILIGKIQKSLNASSNQLLVSYVVVQLDQKNALPRTYLFPPFTSASTFAAASRGRPANLFCQHLLGIPLQC